MQLYVIEDNVRKYGGVAVSLYRAGRVNLLLVTKLKVGFGEFCFARHYRGNGVLVVGISVSALANLYGGGLVHWATFQGYHAGRVGNLGDAYPSTNVGVCLACWGRNVIYRRTYEVVLDRTARHRDDVAKLSSIRLSLARGRRYLDLGLTIHQARHFAGEYAQVVGLPLVWLGASRLGPYVGTQQHVERRLQCDLRGAGNAVLFASFGRHSDVLGR